MLISLPLRSNVQSINQSINLSLSVCVCLSLPACLPICLSLSLCVSVSDSLCLCFCLSVSVCLSVCLFVSVCLSVSVSFSLSPSHLSLKMNCQPSEKLTKKNKIYIYIYTKQQLSTQNVTKNSFCYWDNFFLQRTAFYWDTKGQNAKMFAQDVFLLNIRQIPVIYTRTVYI